MNLALATFGLVLLVTLGIYWLLVVRPERRVQVNLRKRLKQPRLSAEAKIQLEQAEGRLSSVPALHALLSRNGGLLTPLAKFIEESGVRITLGLFLSMSGCAGLGAYLLVQWMTGILAFAILAGSVALFVPVAYVARARTSRLRKFEEQFPEAIDLIARALRAGHAFTTGLGMVAEEMGNPIGAEFRLLYDRQNFGMPLPDAMRAFAERIPLLDPRFFVTAVLTQRESGGNLSEVLDNLAGVIRDRFRVKRQIRVITAHARMTGAVLICFPPVLAFMFMLRSPENMKLLVTDPLGIKMVVGAIVLQITGTYMIRKLIDVEY